MRQSNVSFPSLETPVILVDMDKLEANIKEMAQLAAEAGVRLRPHIKIHESAFIAKLQIEAGACGLEVGSVDQAEFMAEEGFNDIVIVHPFYGSHKFETLKRLLNKPGFKITVVVDMIEQAEAISRAGHAVGRKVPVLLKIDTNRDVGGLQRYGVLPGEPTLKLARKLCRFQGIEFVGIYAHEMGAITTAEDAERVAFITASIVTETSKTLRREGITVEHVSVGASPTFRSTCRYMREGKFPEITEIHPGSCVIGDMSYVMSLGNTRETCALTVLTTVVSTSYPDHAVIDAGSKTLGGDSLITRRDAPGFFLARKA